MNNYAVRYVDADGCEVDPANQGAILRQGVQRVDLGTWAGIERSLSPVFASTRRLGILNSLDPPKPAEPPRPIVGLQRQYFED